jgi:tRNA A37 N6-isopentenylltransferase MiaA
MALPVTADHALTEVDLSRLAREIARDLRPLELTLEQLHISSEQWDRIQNNPIFQTRMVEEAQVWSASTKKNIHERVATKAAAMVEELLFEAVDMVQDKELPGSARVLALQFIAKMGHLGEATMSKDDGSGRVQINIMIGGEKVSFDKETLIDAQATDITPEVGA